MILKMAIHEIRMDIIVHYLSPNIIYYVLKTFVQHIYKKKKTWLDNPGLCGDYLLLIQAFM